MENTNIIQRWFDEQIVVHCPKCNTRHVVSLTGGFDIKTLTSDGDGEFTCANIDHDINFICTKCNTVMHQFSYGMERLMHTIETKFMNYEVPKNCVFVTCKYLGVSIENDQLVDVHQYPNMILQYESSDKWDILKDIIVSLAERYDLIVEIKDLTTMIISINMDSFNKWYIANRYPGHDIEKHANKYLMDRLGSLSVALEKYDNDKEKV